MDQPLAESALQIKQQLEALIELQGVDREILQRRGLIDRLNQRIHDELGRLQSIKDRQASQKTNLDHVIKDRRAAELSSKEKQEQVQKLGSQLFSVKTNEAYNALQSEIRQKNQENSLLEERTLELMVAEDELQAELKGLDAELKAGEKDVAAVQADWRSEITGLEKQIEDLTAQWDLAAKKVRPDHLDLYKRLRNAKGGEALAKIENGICSGCRIAIRPQAAIELKKYRALLYCDNCARILYAD